MDDEHDADVSRYFKPRRIDDPGLKLLAEHLSKDFARKFCEEIGRKERKQNVWAPGPRDWNRHLEPPSLWRARAFAAIALDLLAEDRPGKLEVQAKFVADHYSRILHNKNCTSDTVKKWRERFKKGQVSDGFAVSIFNNKHSVTAIAKYALAKAGETPSARAIAE